VADETSVPEFFSGVSAEPLPPDVELSVASDNVLPHLDVSLTDLTERRLSTDIISTERCGHNKTTRD